MLGARPLKRVIQRRIQNVLALKILRGEFKDGDRIVVDAGPNGQLAFTTGTREPRPSRNQSYRQKRTWAPPWTFRGGTSITCD